MILNDRHGEKIITIFGPPGTGKTTRLLNIVEEEINNGTPIDRIGYFAFTKKAAREAVTRAMKKFNLEKKDFTYFRTLHSLAYHHLNLKSSDVMGDKQYQEVSDWLQLKLYNPNKSVDELGVSLPKDLYLNLIDKSKITGTSLMNQFANCGYHIDGGFDKLNYVNKGLEQFKNKNKLFDYTDMILEFIKKNNAPKLDVVIVDEAQDLSLIQWQMVEQLIRKADRAYLAGDDDQAIFNWAGADIGRLKKIGKSNAIPRREILNQSYRIPKKVHTIAHQIITPVKDRVEKEWKPREYEGELKYHRTRLNSQMNLTNGTWLILARTNYLLDQIAEELRIRGLFFERYNRSSVSEKMLNAIIGWKTLQEGGSIPFKVLKDMYYYMSGNNHIAHGYKDLKAADEEKEYDHEALVMFHGLNVHIAREWHVALDNIPESQQAYITAALRRQQDFNVSKNIKLSTIHAAKGGEADHVMLLTDLPKKVDDNYFVQQDDERRVFYVGVTRAKKSLHVIESESTREFKEIF
jgi:DNA helicase-2/ATP-dependent DNA helicase PcrA